MAGTKGTAEITTSYGLEDSKKIINLVPEECSVVPQREKEGL